MADINRVIKQYFPLDNLVFVLIGKASEIEARREEVRAGRGPQVHQR